MTATISSASTAAALKIRYKDGIDKEDFDKSPTLYKMAPRETDFDGSTYNFTLNTDGTQGLGVDVANAIGNLAQSPNYQFAVSRVRYYSLARVTGEAIKATKGGGAVMSLWEHEVERATYSINRDMAFQFHRDGSGVRATGVSGSGTATITVADDGGINFLSVGMRLQAALTSTGALLSNNAVTISGLDRAARTVTTTGGNWSTQIPGLTDTSVYFRAGDASAGGTLKCLSGMDSWIGTAAIWGLTRTVDPIKLGGQVLSAAGIPLEELVPEACTKLLQMGAMAPDLCILNPDEGLKVRKALIAKSAYNRVEVKSAVAGISFKGFEYDGPQGPVTVLEDINRAKQTAVVGRKASLAMKSLGPCPQILDFDKQEMLRVASDDAYEIRIGMYGNTVMRRPVDFVRYTSVGA